MSHPLLRAAVVCSLALAAPVTTPAGQEAAPQIATDTLTIERDGQSFECYVARPAGDPAAPGLILIHEWWGLNDWVRRQADRFARDGYCAVAVDLYRGEVARDRDAAHELMRGLPDERAVADLQAACDWLRARENAGGKPLAVIGWCMGGGYACKLAIAEPRLAGTVMCYGKPVTDVAQLRRIGGPLLGVWGATDRGIDVASFRQALAEAEVEARHEVYPGAGHAFLNETNERGYNAEQAARAWAEIDRFLERVLRPE